MWSGWNAVFAGRDSAATKILVKFSDLEMHRIIGTGQFGMVRVVRHKKSGEAYALKVSFYQLDRMNGGLSTRTSPDLDVLGRV